MAADFTGTGFTNKDFTGKVSVDIRDSTPDWAPFAEPRAPEGAPNVLYLVWDDTGIGTWDLYGGLVEMPNLRRIADRGVLLSQFHTTALCSPTRAALLTGRNVADLVVEAGLMGRDEVVKQLSPARLSGLETVTAAIPIVVDPDAAPVDSRS